MFLCFVLLCKNGLDLCRRKLAQVEKQRQQQKTEAKVIRMTAQGARDSSVQKPLEQFELWQS